MRPAPRRSFRAAALIVALLAIGVLVPLAWRDRHARPPAEVVTAVPHAAIAPPAAPASPLPEVVPPEEAESESTPPNPNLSFARNAGLHRTPDPMHLSSSVALVVDQDSGEVLMRKNDQVVLPIASLTKLMSMLLVIEAGQPLDEVLTITADDVDTARHSRSRLKVGTRLTRREALRLALMSSENRAAHALGRSYPGGLDALVAAMNARAARLGMARTAYVDPTGLSNLNRSTARDLAVLVNVAAANPLMREFSTTRSHVADLEGGPTLQYINSNRLVRNARSGWDIALQKTGYIVEAGRCMTLLTHSAGRDLILVLLDAGDNRSRLADAERLRRWVVAEYGRGPAVAAKDTAHHQAAAPKGQRSS